MLAITHNVNGIRAADRRGFVPWFEQRQPDVLALQEVRCSTDKLPDIFGDYHLAIDPGIIAGRNGVALLTKVAPEAVRTWTEEPELAEFVDHGRYIEADLADFPVRVASVYVPKGGTADGEPDKYDYKMRFLAAFDDFLTRLADSAAADGRHLLVMGDVNIAHTELDIKNWKGNLKSPGFLPEEREWLDGIICEDRFVDVVRSHHPGEPGPYSWWSWRGQAFANNAGWRIDYHLASPALAEVAHTVGVDREPSRDERISDHAPVFVEYDL